MTPQDAAPAQATDTDAADADPARQAALVALRDLADNAVDLPADARRNLADWADSWVAAPAPADLVARPCPAPAARWHLDMLGKLADAPDLRVRRAYHARLLGHLLAPRHSALRPLVTILIPVYNRAAKVVEAVESCVAQDWRPLEILVVDDGSTDDPSAALQRFGDLVRVLHKPNGGVSSARNAGIAAARGDFIHLLDSDNLLLPEAVSAKVAAFAAIADAELCGSAAQARGYKPGNSMRRRRPTGSHMCPTTDLLRAAVQHCPLFVSTIMIARWAALEAGPFEEDLRYHEDARYWIALGLRRTKAIGLRSPLTIRRSSPGGLSDNLEAGDPVGTVVRLRGLRDLLSEPANWIYAGPLLARVLRGGRRTDPAVSGDPRIRAAMGAVLAIVDDLIRRRECDGLSTLPLIAGLRHALWRAIEDGLSFDGASDLQLVELAERLAGAAHEAAPLSARDIAYWRRPCATAQVAHRLQVWARFAEKLLDDPQALATLDWLMRRSWRIPRKRGLRRVLRWQRWLRSAWLARRLALLRVGVRNLPHPRNRPETNGTTP